MQSINSNPFYLLSQWQQQAEVFVKNQMGDKPVVVQERNPCQLLSEIQHQAEQQALKGAGKKYRKLRSRFVRSTLPTINIMPVLNQAKEIISCLEHNYSFLRPADMRQLARQSEELDKSSLTPSKLTELTSPLLGSDAGIIETLRAEIDRFKFGTGDLDEKKRRLVDSFSQHIRALVSWKGGGKPSEKEHQNARERIQFLEENFTEYLKSYKPSQGKKHKKSTPDLEVAKKITEIMECFGKEIESIKGVKPNIFFPKKPPPPVEQPLKLMEWVREELSKAEQKNSRDAPDTPKVNSQLSKLSDYINQLIKEDKIFALDAGDRRSIVQIHDDIRDKTRTEPVFKDYRLTVAKITPAIDALRTVNEKQQDNTEGTIQANSLVSPIKRNPPQSVPAGNSADIPAGASGYTPDPTAAITAKQPGNTGTNINTTVKELLAEAIEVFNENQHNDEERIRVSDCLHVATKIIPKEKITTEAIEELMRAIETSSQTEPNIKTLVKPLINALSEAYSKLLITE